MGSISRRQAVSLGAAGGAAALAAFGRAEAAGGKDVIFADEKAVLFKIRDVTIDAVDQARRMIGVSFGKADAPVTVTGLPLADNITIRVSFIYPGSVNNVPFDWDRLKGLVGKNVSMHLRAEASGLAVASIAVAND